MFAAAVVDRGLSQRLFSHDNFFLRLSRIFRASVGANERQMRHPVQKRLCYVFNATSRRLMSLPVNFASSPAREENRTFQVRKEEEEEDGGGKRPLGGRRVSIFTESAPRALPFSFFVFLFRARPETLAPFSVRGRAFCVSFAPFRSKLPRLSHSKRLVASSRLAFDCRGIYWAFN